MEKKQNLMKKLMKEMAKGGDRTVKKQNSTQGSDDSRLNTRSDNDDLQLGSSKKRQSSQHMKR